MDVIIAYRIGPKKAHLIVQYVADSDRLLRDKLVRTIARSKPRDIFGELKTEEYKRKLEEAKGEVNKMVANAEGEYRRAKIEADVHFEKQELIAEAIKTEGIATAKGIQEMNNAMAGSGGEALVKLRIAEAIQGKNLPEGNKTNQRSNSNNEWRHNPWSRPSGIPAGHWHPHPRPCRRPCPAPAADR